MHDIQDPDEAEVPAMPLNAMRRGQIDYVLPVEEMPRVIMGLLVNGRPTRTRQSPSKRPRTESPSRMKTRANDRRLSSFTAALDHDIDDLKQRAANPRKRQAHG